MSSDLISLMPWHSNSLTQQSSSPRAAAHTAMETKAMRAFILLLAVCFTAAGAHGEPTTWQREGWNKTDFARTRISWNEIVSGGPPRDGIPPIDQPTFVPAAADKDLAANEPVIGLEIDGDARAYPLRILIWHEIVNDTVGGAPVAVTYCPLCNSSVVFDRRVGARVFDFGTTGKLRNSDLVMYDRQTESWWQQFTGESIVGEMVGTELKLVPARLESFADFRARHANGRVLVPNDPNFRRYGQNPYVSYDSARSPFLFYGELPKNIEPMARVVVVRRGQEPPLIVTLEHVRRHGSIKVGRIELAWKAGQASAVDTAEIARGRDVGSIVAEEIADSGTRRPLVYDVTFAFVAHAFHADVPIRD